MRSSKTRTLLVALWHHLSRRRHWQFASVLGLTLVSAGAEVMTLGAVLPFIGVLTAPERVYSYPLVSAAAEVLGVSSSADLILPLTVAFVCTALLAGAVRLLLLWVSVRLAVATGADLSSEVYRKTLYQPYSTHISRNSSEVISGLTSKLDAVVSGVVMPVQSLVGSLVLIVAVVTALVLVDPAISVVALIGFGGCYLILTISFRKRLRLNSLLVAQKQTEVVKWLQEGIGGIRDVLLDGTQGFFSSAYGDADRQFRHARGNNLFISGSPRFAMEALGMALIAGLAFAMSQQADGFTARLPVLAALVIGGQRLLPAMQQTYAAWTGILGGQAQLEEVVGLLSQPMPGWTRESPPTPLEFKESIRFEEVSFRYFSEGPLVLDRVSLEIPRGASVGIVGATGSGKSTALDLLMGFLDPTLGRVLVDGHSVSDARRRSWQSNIAHVPQVIFLADASFAENIAFGIPLGMVDMGRVREVAGLAAVADFIESQPDGYGAKVGERGVKISGGQRQRIGIARALYKGAQVLVLDEATSALDGKTERLVTDAIDRERAGLTVVVVAHRLTSLSYCDNIYQFHNGCVVAEGTLEELMAGNSRFRQMAGPGASP